MNGVDQNQNRIGVLGATSFVGNFLLDDLVGAKKSVVAFSRHPVKSASSAVEWVQIPDNLSSVPLIQEIPFWVSLMPIWLLPYYFPLLQRLGIQRLVVLSSTSRFTKINSVYAEERALAQRLADAEESILTWGRKNQIQIVLLQSTMIYANGRDKNVSSIAHFIQRFGFFPLFGSGCGLRQPVHGQDVTFACCAALEKSRLKNSYILSGGETLSYREMVQRIFLSLNKPVRLLSFPLWTFKAGVLAVNLLGKKMTAGVAERMNQDLVFDHIDAARDLGFAPRKFEL